MYYFIAIFNVIALYLAIINNRNTWWFAILGTTLTSIMFFDNMMISSFLFNVYSTVCSIIALFTWKKTSSENKMIFEWDNITWLAAPLGVVLGILNFHVFNSENVLFDTIGPICAITATYLLVRKNALSYIYWIYSDINYLILGIITNTTHYIVIYTVMLLLSIYGLERNTKTCF